MIWMIYILAYISKSSNQYAKAMFEDISKAINNLKKFPKMGREVPESENPEYRELIIRNYRLIYRFNEKGQKIIISFIIHGSRLFRLQ